MDHATQRVAELLAFYMRRAFEAAGLGWDGDNEGEMYQVAEAIADMVTVGVREHAENAPHLHPDGSQG